MSSTPVVWITGLSGVGKTTLATALVAAWRGSGTAVVHLDGDGVRAAVDGDHTRYDSESRRRNAERIGRLTAMLSDQGFPAVVSTVSLFHAVRAWNRSTFQRYVEVWVRADAEAVLRHDVRGIYAQADGASVAEWAELPDRPEIVVYNDFRPETIGWVVAGLRAHLRLW